MLLFSVVYTAAPIPPDLALVPGSMAPAALACMVLEMHNPASGWESRRYRKGQQGRVNLEGELNSVVVSGTNAVGCSGVAITPRV